MMGPRRPGPGGAAIQAMANIDTTTTTDAVYIVDAEATQQQEPTSTNTVDATATISTPTVSSALVAMPENDRPPHTDNNPNDYDNALAPTLPVLNKIEPSPATARPKTQKRKRIIIPQRSCSGGLDFKFETDPHNVRLHDLLSPQEYTQAIESLNETIRPARATKLDGALLVTGPLMVPLAVWGIRHNRQTKRRKRLLKEAIESFNNERPTLYMRWNRDTGGSYLSIEARQEWQQQQQQQEQEGRTQPLKTGLEDSNVFV